MAATRLKIYNDALLFCGERTLASLTEDVEPRHLLDHVWNSDGVQGCLEEAQWHFAIRTVQIDYDPDEDPQFGYNYAFTKPSDWVLTSALCSDEYFKSPLLGYWDEAGFWYADLQTIYVRYISNDVDYGMDLSLWPRSFSEFVAAHFAYKITPKITGDKDRFNAAFKLREKLLRDAKNRTAMADSTKFAPQGGWTKSRMNGGGRKDGGGSSGNLIG